MRRTLKLSFLSGLLLTLSFAPFGLWPLAFIAFVPVLSALFSIDAPTLKAGVKRGFITGLFFGFFFFLGTIYWVVNSIFYFGGVPFVISISVMLLLVLVMALYPALFGAGVVLCRLSKMPQVLILVFLPALWVAIEYIRGHFFFLAFPWVLTGYTQVPFRPLIQVADLFGVWGVGFL
ncbi:MAG: apolipoprotein N-acyltransferase, partial [Thermodesulfobacteriota bacterium]